MKVFCVFEKQRDNDDDWRSCEGNLRYIGFELADAQFVVNQNKRIYYIEEWSVDIPIIFLGSQYFIDQEDKPEFNECVNLIIKIFFSALLLRVQLEKGRSPFLYGTNVHTHLENAVKDIADVLTGRKISFQESVVLDVDSYPEMHDYA